MVVTYKCPTCGADLVFDSEQQKLICEHCGTTKTVEEMQQAGTKDEEIKQEMPEDRVEDFRVFRCPTCGAEILTDEHTSAAFCSYCGSTALIESRLTGEKAPTAVIPFKISRQQAMEAYRNWARRGVLTPRVFSQQSTVEKVTGMYVPFWLYDYESDVRMRADCTRVRTERHGDTEYIHTDHFDVYREVAATFERIPADASEKMDDQVMDKLEPFDYHEMKEFEMPYLSGYLAEKYNFTSDELKPRVEQRLNQYASSLTRETIGGYAGVQVVQEDIQLAGKKANYVLLPVWMLNYRYQGENYQFTMNGQTGKIVGTLPTSKKRLAAWFAGVTACTFLVAYAILLFVV